MSNANLTLEKFNKLLPNWLNTSQFFIDDSEAEPISVDPYVGLFKVKSSFQVVLGQKVQLQIQSSNTKIITEALISSVSQSPSGFIEVILHFLRLLESHRDFLGESLLDLNDCYQKPMLWCDHTFYFNTRIFLTVTSLGIHFCRADFPETPPGLITETILNMNICLPAMGVYSVQVMIKGVNYSVKNAINECELQFISYPSDFLENFGRYILLQKPFVSKELLEKLSMSPRNLDSIRQFGFVCTKEDFDEVLKLRYEAHRSKPNCEFPEGFSPAMMEDSFDHSSLIFKVSVGLRLIGSVRLVLNNGDLSLSEVAQYISIPDWMRKDGFAEISRMVTTPDFQGMDVFELLSAHLFRTSFQCGIRYLLSDCEEHLLGAYKKGGAKELFKTFVHPIEGKVLHVIYYDLMDAIQLSEQEGRLHQMYDFLKKRNFIKLGAK